MINNEFDKNFTILLMVSQKYSSLLSGYIKLYEKNWPKSLNLSLKISIEVNQSQKNIYDKLSEKYEIFHESSNSWSQRLLNALEKIETKFVIIMLEDYWIFKTINPKKIMNLFLASCEFDINHIGHLYKKKNAHFDLRKIRNSFGLKLYEQCYSSGRSTEYFIGAGGIYNKETLKSVININENAWEFETNASNRFVEMNFRKVYRNIGKSDYFGYPDGGIISKGAIRSKKIDQLILNEKIELNWKKVYVHKLSVPIIYHHY